MFAFTFNVLNAQNTKEVNLNQVTINASRIVNKADGMILIPTDSQRKGATNGYSMLGKLGLPYIRIDETKHSITALGNQGDVQIRINNVIATKEDMLAINSESIKRIDFIDNSCPDEVVGLVRTGWTAYNFFLKAASITGSQVGNGQSRLLGKWTSKPVMDAPSSEKLIVTNRARRCLPWRSAHPRWT